MSEIKQTIVYVVYDTKENDVLGVFTDIKGAELRSYNKNNIVIHQSVLVERKDYLHDYAERHICSQTADIIHNTF